MSELKGPVIVVDDNTEPKFIGKFPVCWLYCLSAKNLKTLKKSVGSVGPTRYFDCECVKKRFG